MLSKLKPLKPYVSIILILATLVGLVYYLKDHSKLINTLQHLSIFNLLLITFLYIVMLLVLVLIFRATVLLLGIKLDFKLNLMVNIYSLFMNFFIPGQTGPIYRAYVLKQRYKVMYRSFLLITIIYFLFYSLISIIFILVGSKSFILNLLSLILMLCAFVFFKLYLKKFAKIKSNLVLKNIPGLIIITFVQVSLQTLIYYIEIKTVSGQSSLNLLSVLAYSGIANLAIFVSLTPGAIGIREAFLLLSKKLIHISSSTIILANVVDRSINIIFLAILGIFILIFHISEKLSNPRELSRN